MSEEVKVSVVRRRTRVLAGLGTTDYVNLWSPSEPDQRILSKTIATKYLDQKGGTYNG